MRNLMTGRLTLPVLSLLSAIAIPAFGQSGAIKGTLVDPQGTTIPNAKVIAIDESKGVAARETTTVAPRRSFGSVGRTGRPGRRRSPR